MNRLEKKPRNEKLTALASESAVRIGELLDCQADPKLIATLVNFQMIMMDLFELLKEPEEPD